jgi:hypothetical protein
MQTPYRPEALMPKLILTLFALLVGLASLLSAQSTQFSLAVAPQTLTMTQGSAAQFTVTVGGSDKGKIDISLSGLPEGVRAHIPATHPGQMNITLAASPTATVGTFSVTVIAATPDNEQTQIFILEVKPMPVVPQWEYAYASASSEPELTQIANHLGAQSWELVSVVFVRDAGWVGFFKRLRKSS